MPAAGDRAEPNRAEPSRAEPGRVGAKLFGDQSREAVWRARRLGRCHYAIGRRRWRRTVPATSLRRPRPIRHRRARQASRQASDRRRRTRTASSSSAAAAASPPPLRHSGAERARGGRRRPSAVATACWHARIGFAWM